MGFGLSVRHCTERGDHDPPTHARLFTLLIREIQKRNVVERLHGASIQSRRDNFLEMSALARAADALRMSCLLSLGLCDGCADDRTNRGWFAR
jgi:hypothetical protein